MILSKYTLTIISCLAVRSLASHWSLIRGRCPCGIRTTDFSKTIENLLQRGSVGENFVSYAKGVMDEFPDACTTCFLKEFNKRWRLREYKPEPEKVAAQGVQDPAQDSGNPEPEMLKCSICEREELPIHFNRMTRFDDLELCERCTSKRLAKTDEYKSKSVVFNCNDCTQVCLLSTMVDYNGTQLCPTCALFRGFLTVQPAAHRLRKCEGKCNAMRPDGLVTRKRMMPEYVDLVQVRNEDTEINWTDHDKSQIEGLPDKEVILYEIRRLIPVKERSNATLELDAIQCRLVEPELKSFNRMVCKFCYEEHLSDLKFQAHDYSNYLVDEYNKANRKRETEHASKRNDLMDKMNADRHNHNLSFDEMSRIVNIGNQIPIIGVDYDEFSTTNHPKIVKWLEVCKRVCSPRRK